MWILPSPHEVDGFIMVLHWMSRLLLLSIIKIGFFICSAPTTQQTICGYPGWTLCLADSNWEEINTGNAIACKATLLQLFLVRTSLLGEPFRALCIMSKLPFSNSQSFKFLFKLYLLVLPFISIVMWLC